MQSPEDYKSEKSNMEPKYFRVPIDLSVTTTTLNRAIIIGSCNAVHISWSFRNTHGIETDFFHIGRMLEPDVVLLRPPSDYDFMLINVPMDGVLPLASYFSNFASLSNDEINERFSHSADMTRMYIDGALRWRSNYKLPTFVCNFMVPQQNPLGRLMPRYDLRNVAHYVEKLNEVIYSNIIAHNNVHYVDIDAIAATFGKRLIQDDFIWSLSHNGVVSDYDNDELESTRAEGLERVERIGPLSEYYHIERGILLSAAAHEITNAMRIVRQQDQVKLIVVDLDDTVWRGVIAEQDQPDWQFNMQGWPLGFVEALAFAKQRGILLAIISKNDRDKVETIWKKLLAPFFPLSNFVSVKINWNLKIENMNEILKETNLLSKSVLYIDDNPVERAAMAFAFPDMRILGANPYVLRRIVLWSAETQVVTISNEGGRRTEMVQKQVERERSRKTLSREQFLQSLAVRMTITRITSIQNPSFTRALELINKTNQFNTTGNRWKIEDCEAALSQGMIVYSFEVIDKFVNYGAVIIAFVRRNEIVQIVMSCRVIGMEAELAAIRAIEDNVREKGFAMVIGSIAATEANVLSRDLFSRAGYSSQVEGCWTRNLDTSLPFPAHIVVEPA